MVQASEEAGLKRQSYVSMVNIEKNERQRAK